MKTASDPVKTTRASSLELGGASRPDKVSWALVAVLFGATMFWSATLLFCVEPMVAKMLLPRLGGTPAVWNTCLVFFQTALLAGYAYAHFATSRLSLRAHAILHVAIMIGAVLLLPITVPREAIASWPRSEYPALPLLTLLVVRVGLPFFLVASSAPLLQRWFASTRSPSAHDPYFLYGASNAGSLIALAGYPLLCEPALGLSSQSHVWAVGYALLVALTAACAFTSDRLARKPQSASAAADARDPVAPPLVEDAPISWRRSARWVALGAIPSSLLLGETTYVTTDIAAVPLLWTLPLAVYLVTFILVFAKRPILRHAWMLRILPLLVTATLLLLFAEANDPLWAIVLLHVITFFVASMVCHGELARDRPPARDLTRFYLLMSLGGALGGTFNALVAPLIFNRIVEYPLALIAACLFVPSAIGTRPSRAAVDDRSRAMSLVFPAIVGLLAVALVLGFRAVHLPSAELAPAIIFGPPLLLNYASSRAPRRFALGLAAILTVTMTLYAGILGRSLHDERSFFGSLRVSRDPEEKWVQLVNGNTVHGRQWIDPEKRNEPTLYYSRIGPVPDLFRISRKARNGQKVALIGLGIGTLAPYAEAGEAWTYFELDPNVERLARDPRYFTFLRDFRQDATLDVVLGDARRNLENAIDGTYGLIVLDAFSSDSVPVHLITREALSLYRAKATKDAIFAFHISNRYLDLISVIGALAGDAHLPVACWKHETLDDASIARGSVASTWCALGANPDVPIDALFAADSKNSTKRQEITRWIRIDPSRDRVWTDDYSSLLGHIQW